ncbi:DUF4198 domain-containing protein [Pedobacter hiemivivus]|uniref:DUF4198 domain-containing protein n=1 Tax=Pedobacter hiemivivus TaxID=2530454 RepID=A0A4R0MDM4_9SPHI|nr:DUF4198 domain-containing protein [Pedobacter hiemivivus]TCC84490.1 DUF4198 domain-containing protein [Pedobacter hiemivivus]TKC55178.1 DUF4198 domain-containing protein [Pedobacter hiemivivus]
MKSLLLALLFTLGTSQLFAHALWIETASSGKTGQAQEVKVYYGEYATNEREETAKWYSNVKDFTLWLTAPGKEKIKLTTTPGTNFYSASFAPEGNGQYVLTVSHEAAELGGTTKYEFIAAAIVTVGKPSAVDVATIPVSLKVHTVEAKTYKVNAPIQIKAIANGKPLAKTTVSVFSPEGWSKEVTTDENGVITFSPIWPGRYVLEVSAREKTEGTHNGKAYTAAWQGATSSFEVSK